jgi:hypothetical protein
MKEINFSKEQAHQFALDIFDVLVRDIKAEENNQETTGAVEQCREERRAA